MKHYAVRLERMSAQPASIDASIYHGVLVRMFVKCFEDQSTSSFGVALFALAKRDDLNWQLTTSRVFREFASQQHSRLMEETSQDKAFVVQATRPNRNKNQRNSSRNSMTFCYCGKKRHVRAGKKRHVRAECFRRKREKSTDVANKKHKEDKG